MSDEDESENIDKQEGEHSPEDVVVNDDSKDMDVYGTVDDLEPVDNAEKIDEVISDSVSKMYALKAKYINKLGELERAVYKEYSSLPKSKQNKSTKKEIVMSNIDYVTELEKTCDTEVAKVLASLKQNLIKLGGDTEIIQTLQDAYKEEKEMRKSYYLSLYND